MTSTAFRHRRQPVRRPRRRHQHDAPPDPGQGARWSTWATTARSRTSCARPSARTPTASRCRAYQGGHNEYFKYMVDMLAERGAEHIRCSAAVAAPSRPEEIRSCRTTASSASTTRNDGMKMGLKEMIEDLWRRTRAGARGWTPPFRSRPTEDEISIGRMLVGDRGGPISRA
jgi:hypothetical protein